MHGGLFFQVRDDNENVTTTAVVAKLRGEGKLSKKDPRKLEGFGADGVVGIAVHPPRDGWLAVIDSADGAQGINPGGWAACGTMSNHLHADAVWYRVYTPGLAVGARFFRGNDHVHVVAGDRARVEAWLDEQGVPWKTSAPPSSAEDATLIAVKYDEEKYRSGPSEADAVRLAELASALVAGDANVVGEHLALGVVRAETRGKVNLAIARRARELLDRPATLRASPKVETMDEVVLARAALSADDATAMIARIDEIERAAEKQSSWALTNGLSHLGWKLEHVKKYGAAFECYSRLARRPRPAYHHVLAALRCLLKRSEGPITLEGDVKATVDACAARVTELGSDAQDAIYYDLACVAARAGLRDLALRQLKACKAIRKINPRPEEDPDFVSLWEDDAFLELLDLPKKTASSGEVGAPEEPEDAYEVPAERAVPRMSIELAPGGDPRALTNRLGGLPVAPAASSPWPESSSRPMQLVAQLVGKAAGGELDLGDIGVLQIFADLEGEYFDDNEVVVHRQGCPHVLEAPVGVEVLPTKTMKLVPGMDDKMLLDADAFENEDYDGANGHAFCDKLFGVPVGANLDVENIVDSKGERMRLLLELITYDDWFLWALFTNADFSETRLEIVRG